MKSSAYLIFYRHLSPPYMGQHPTFLQNNLDSPFYDFSKILPPIDNGEIDEGYIWVWSIIQTNRKQNASNRKDFKEKVRLSLYDCRNAQTNNPV